MKTFKPAIRMALALALLGPCLSARPLPAAAAPLFQAGLQAGLLSGLDSLARGCQAGFELALALGQGGSGGQLDEEAGASVGLSAFAAWDGGLASAFAGLELRLGFGPSLTLSCGWELPLGDPRLRIPEASALAHLGCAGFPSRLALEARLARFLAGDGRRPSLDLVAGLSWSAYRVLSTEAAGGEGGAEAATVDGTALAEALAGKAGFAAGLRAGILLELRWGGP